MYYAVDDFSLPDAIDELKDTFISQIRFYLSTTQEEQSFEHISVFKTFIPFVSNAITNEADRRRHHLKRF